MRWTRMPLGHRLGAVSGRVLTEATWLGFRHHAGRGLDHRFMESWVVQTAGDLTPHLAFRAVGRLGEPWRSPDSGVTFVPSYHGQVHMVPPDASPVRQTTRTSQLNGVLVGAWGLSDDYVFVWGDAPGGGNVTYLWNGARWNLVPSPGPGVVWGMHGVARDVIFAVGREGLIARWDGHNWTRMPTGVPTVLSRVVVVSEDEAYATGPGRFLLEGSIHGWAQVLYADFPLSGLAVRGDELWLGSWENGLWRLQRDKLVPINEDITIGQMDGRGSELLMTTEDEILGTVDGKEMRASTVDMFQRLCEMHADLFPYAASDPVNPAMPTL